MADLVDILVPDIGDFDAVEIIEIAVQTGDQVNLEDTLITLESDKATMEIPATATGTVKEVMVNIGDTVSQGTLILKLEPAESAIASAPEGEEKPEIKEPEPALIVTDEDSQSGDSPLPIEPEPAVVITDEDLSPQSGPRPAPPAPISTQTIGASDSSKAHASPSVRKFARELGVDLGLVRGSARKGRISKDDVKAFTKAVMSDNRIFDRSGGFSLPKIPPVDFSKFGPIQTRPLSRLKRLGGQNLHRSWINVPHVTQFDETDITELDAFRQSKKTEAEQHGTKLTLLSFLIKAVVVTLKKYPEFNASLSPNGEELIYKNYFHIGIAVNTEQGLMVPVVKDADKKGMFDLATELAELAQKARDKKLKPADMQGGCFTISSLGHIGGTGFTPIVNTPEVAILGVSKSTIQPVYMDGKFAPRLILPYSLSYDHRIIDGVAAAEFTRTLGKILTDIRDILL